MPRSTYSQRLTNYGLLVLFACCHWSYAATLTVAKDDSRCPGAKYKTIGAAITAAASGDEILICPALYPEQLIITRPVTLRGVNQNGRNRVLVQPAAMTNLGVLPYQAVISVVNTANVTIDGLAIDASHNSVSAACDVTLAAVHFYNSSGSVTDNAISGSQLANPQNCKFFPGNGFGIEVDTAAGQTGPFRVLIQGNSIHDFNRVGIFVAGAGIAARINRNTISGVGPSAGYSQFGVMVANGALGQVIGNTISQGSCGSIDFVTCINLRSEGVVFRSPADESVADSNFIANVQSGILLNVANRARVTNNTIMNVDAIDGIDGLAGLTNSHISGNTITHVFPISNFSSVEWAGCGINIYSGAGSGMNIISDNTVNDAYCGVAYVTGDHVFSGTYINTLYATLNEDLYPNAFPPAVEPGQ